MRDVIERVVSGIRQANPDTDAVAIAEMLWLACVLSTGTPSPQATTDTEASEDVSGLSETRPEVPSNTNVNNAPAKMIDGGAVMSAQPASRVRVPSGPSLPQHLEIARSLRPFKKKWRTGRQRRLDIEETIRSYAHIGDLIPLFKPDFERWFDVELVVDQTPNMSVWNPTINELADVLAATGAFRTVHRWQLRYSDRPQLCDRTGREVPSQLLCSPNARRLILVISDCEAGRWREGNIWRLIQTWSQSTPTALINPMPARLWHYGELSIPIVRAGPGWPGNSNAGFTFEQPTVGSQQTAGRSQNTLAVPVLALSPLSLSTWAATLMRSDPAGCPALLIPPPQPQPQPEDEEVGAPPSAAELVTGFTSFASRPARKLAILCSPYPRLTMPIVQLIRQHLVPEATASDIAEFIGGGLLQTPASEGALLRFREGVAERLRGLVPVDRSWQTYELLTRHIADKIGTMRAMPALVADPLGALTLPADLIPFAEASVQTLHFLGFSPPPPPDEPSTGQVTQASGTRGQDLTKLVVVGTTESGKQAVLASLLTDPVVYPPGGAGLHVRVWDFGGLEPDQKFRQAVIGRDVLHLLVCGESEESDEQASAWLQRINEASGGTAAVLVVLTTGDASGTVQRACQKYASIVAVVEKVDLASSNAMTKIRELIAVHTPTTTSMGSATWRAVRDELSAMAHRYPIMVLETVADVASRHGIHRISLPSFLEWLDHAGGAVYFASDSRLNDSIILNLDWVSQQIALALRDNTLIHSGGLVSRAAFIRPWAEHQDHATFLLSLMERFGILHQSTDKTKILVGGFVAAAPGPGAQFLPASSGAIDLILRTETAITGLIAQLTLRCGDLGITSHWRGGFTVEDRASKSRALIQQQADSSLRVQASGAASHTYMESVRRLIAETIRDLWPRQRVHALVPCINHPSCTHLFPYELLVHSAADAVLACRQCLAANTRQALLYGVTGDGIPSGRTIPFVISVLAPSLDDLPAERRPEHYGQLSSLWRPFATAHELPIAEHVARAAQAFRLPTLVTDFASVGDLPLDDAPGVILIDPWILATPAGRPMVSSALAGTRDWVGVVVVVDRFDPQFSDRGNYLLAELMQMTATTSPVHRRTVLRDAAELDLSLGRIIGRIRRHYLSHHPAHPADPQPQERPRLSGPPPPPRQEEA